MSSLNPDPELQHTPRHRSDPHPATAERIHAVPVCKRAGLHSLQLLLHLRPAGDLEAAGPRHRDQDKLSPYECGERPSGSGRLQFNIRFYIIALAFLVFDVEIAFMFPVGKVMRSFVDSGQGWFVLVEVLLFILILFLGLVYLWRKGDLDWVKDLQVSRTDAPIELRRQSQSRPE